MRRLWLILLAVLAGTSLGGMSLWQEPVELERFDNVSLDAAYIASNGKSLLNWQQSLYEQTQYQMSCFSPEWQDQWQHSINKRIKAISGNSNSYFYIYTDSWDMRVCKISQNGNQYWGSSGFRFFSPDEYSSTHELILLPDSEGGVFIVWKTSQYSNDYCMIQYINPSGVPTMSCDEMIIAENDRIYLEDAVLLADGSVAVTTAVRGMVNLYKINKSGLRKWHKEIVTEPSRFPHAAVSTAGTGNIILGIAHGDRAGITRYSYSGSALDAEQILCYTGAEDAYFIDLTPSEDCVYVNVCDYPQSANLLQKLSNTGEVLYPNFISLYDVGYDINFGIYPAENGECYAVFNNGVDVITAKRLSSSGATLWERDLLNVTNMNTINNPFVGRCIDDVLHVVWMDFRADASGIYAQTLSPQGDELFSNNGLPVQVGSRGVFQYSDIVTLDESCAVLWVTLINDTDLKANLQIIGKDGEQVFNPEPLSLGNNIIGDSEQAARIFAVGDNALVLWREQTDVQKLKAQLFTSDGLMLWGNDGIIIAEGQIGSFCASVVDGAIMIAYDSSDDSGVYSIYLQKVINGTTQWQPGGICLVQSDVSTYGQLEDFTGQYLLWTKMTSQSNDFCVLRVESDGNISPGFPDDGLQLHLFCYDYFESYLMTDKLVLMYYYAAGMIDYSVTMLRIIDAQGNILADNGDIMYYGNITPSFRGDYIYTAEVTSELVARKYNLQQELIWEYHFQYPGLDSNAYSWARVVPLSDDEYIVLFSGTQPDCLLYAYFDAAGNFILPGESQIFGVPLIHITRASLAEEGLFVLAEFPPYGKLWLQHIGHHTDPIPDSELIPEVDILLLTNKPNPFRENTSLRIYLQEEIPIEVQIFNTRGQLVKDLYSGILQKGLSNMHWNGRNNNGDICASGVYFIRLTSRFGTQTSKVLKLN